VPTTGPAYNRASVVVTNTPLPMTFATDTGAEERAVFTADGCLRVSAEPFLDCVAAGEYPTKEIWTKIGYTPTMNATRSAIWSAAGVYTFPPAAIQMEVVSSNNVTDFGTVIRGSFTVPVTSDAGGSLTTLVDASENFAAATAVQAGDCLILDPAGTTPEWGYITTVAATILTCSGGFSSGGTGASRKYIVIDATGGAGAYTGAQAVKIDYLDSAFAKHSVICNLNGTTAVTTKNDAGGNLTDLYRINGMRVIAAGAVGVPAGNLTFRGVGGGTVFTYITLGFNRARNAQYTVPTGKTLYIVEGIVGFGYTGASKVEYARITLAMNREPTTMFKTGSIFYPYAEAMMGNGNAVYRFSAPVRCPTGSDIRVTGESSAAGVAACMFRGWLE
jgi:hypothetical protein